MSQPIWIEQLRDSFKSSEEIASFLEIQIDTPNYPVLIPKRIAHKIKHQDQNKIWSKQFLPSSNESLTESWGLKDPIGDQNFLVTGQLIHRYKNRALFIPTKVCPIICRYCFRKNELYNPEVFNTSDFENTLRYLNEHSEIEEIIFSGGDPFILSDNKIEFILSEFSKISHIKYIRFHTRFLTILPERFTDSLSNILKINAEKFRSINLVFHINHADEIDEQVKESLLKLKSTQCSLLSQTVLLKNVNDDEDTLKHLFMKLYENGIRPYYLHHPDQAKGTKHFYLSLEEGRKIYTTLKKSISTWALPHYVIDNEDGSGKKLIVSEL